MVISKVLGSTVTSFSAKQAELILKTNMMVITIFFHEFTLVLKLKKSDNTRFAFIKQIILKIFIKSAKR